MSTNWIEILKDKQVKTVIISSLIIVLLVFVASFISAEIRGSNGERVKWLWGAVEYNTECDTLAEQSVRQNENNTQINQPNAPVQINN